jgi:cell wall-associated NlpC family hydrolase
MLLFLVAAFMSAESLGIVCTPVADMYASASAEAAVVSQAIYGSAVTLTDGKNGWAKVRTADGYTGWMPESSFRKLAAGEAAYASAGRVARIESLFANLYQEPDVTKHRPILTVPFETRLEIVAEPEAGGRWLEARLVDGRTAWVQRGDLSFDAAPLSTAATIALAQRFLGMPYLWGGTSTFGYDCSGFIQMLYRYRGVMLPRDAQPQADWGGFAPVERDALQPGDLVYFGQSAKKITHTGMYLGDGRFISATPHGKPVVQIDRLDDPYWSALYVAARRLK